MSLILSSMAFPIFAADLIIEDFDRSDMNDDTLQDNVFAFGTATEAGKPIFAEGLGVDGSNAICLILTWETGNNANLSLINLSSNTRNLSRFSKVKTALYLEASQNSSRNPARLTRVKLAVEGGSDDTIWQTRSVQAARPEVDVYNELEFGLSSNQMERVKGSSSLFDTLSEIKTIRLRFENAKSPGLLQDAYIDSIVATKDKRARRFNLFKN